MKVIRYIKLRTFAQGPIDLIFERNNNPLKQSMAIGELSHDFTRDFLAQFQVPVDLIQAGSNTSVTFLNRWAFSRAIYTFPVS
jgi:proteasome activator subunit 4